MGLLRAARAALESGDMFTRGGPLNPALMYREMASPTELRGLAAMLARKKGKQPVETFKAFDDLTAVQPWVHDDFLEAASRNKGKPLVARMGGKDYLVDGYHRSAAEAARGREGVLANFLDLDTAALLMALGGGGLFGAASLQGQKKAPWV